MLNSSSNHIAATLNILNEIARKMKQLVRDELSKQQTEDLTNSPSKEFRSEFQRELSYDLTARQQF